MPGKLLILTYRGAGALTGEDLRFKEAAIRLKLISGDAMDETGQNNDGPKPYFDAHRQELLHDPKKRGPSGVDVASLNASTKLVTLNRLGPHTWGRSAYARTPLGPPRNVFETWLDKVFAIPIEVLVLAGHHSGSLVWGAQQSETAPYYQHSALRPFLNGRPQADIHAYDAKLPNGDAQRAGPFDLSTALRTCRLLVVLGCNGATGHITAWRNVIKKARGRAPWIFSFYGVHAMPRDADAEFVSPGLWTRLEALAPGSAGSKNLDFLDDAGFEERIRACWFEALNAAFGPKSIRRHLFYSDKSSKSRGPRGAGVVDPSGRIFKVVNSAGTVKEDGQLP